MRSTTTVVGADWTYACVAVYDYGVPRADAVRNRFSRAGMIVLEDRGEISATAPGATVLHAFRPVSRTGPEGRMRITQRLVTAATIAFTVPHLPRGNATFQPVWWTAPLQPLHLEVLVVDDDDADRQLRQVARGLGVQRDDVELVPRWGWNGYRPAVPS